MKSLCGQIGLLIFLVRGSVMVSEEADVHSTKICVMHICAC